MSISRKDDNRVISSEIKDRQKRSKISCGNDTEKAMGNTVSISTGKDSIERIQKYKRVGCEEKPLNDKSDNQEAMNVPIFHKESENRIVSFNGNAHEILVSDELKQKIRRCYKGALVTLDENSIKRVLGALYEELFVMDLNMVNTVIANRHETSPMTIDWEAKVDKYSKILEKLITEACEAIGQGTSHAISSQIKGILEPLYESYRSCYKQEYPENNDFLLYALYINALHNEGYKAASINLPSNNDHNEDEISDFYRRRDIKSERVEEFTSRVKSICAEKFADILYEAIIELIKNAIDSNVYASSLLNLEKINMGVMVVFVTDKNSKNGLPGVYVHIMDMTELKA